MTQPTYGLVFNDVSTDNRPAQSADLSVIGLVLPASDADATAFPQDIPVTFDSSDATMLGKAGNGALAQALNDIDDQLADFQSSARVVVTRVAAGANDAETMTNLVGTRAARTGLYSLLTAGTRLGVVPRLIGVLFKRVPKFGVLLGYTALSGDADPGYMAATAASILSAPFINPVRMIEKQQRAFMKTTGAEKPIAEILREAAAKNFAPLFRGTVPLMGHSFASAVLGLVGQPQLQKYIQKELGQSGVASGSVTNLIASAVVSPIYVVVTNPLSRLEVIMQTNSIKGKSIGVLEAMREMGADMTKFGLRGVFRGQGIGIAKAIVSLSLFHEGRMLLHRTMKGMNEAAGLRPKA